MTFAPQFWMSVRGMTSRACATDRYGHCCTPSTLAAFSLSAADTAWARGDAGGATAETLRVGYGVPSTRM